MLTSLQSTDTRLLLQLQYQLLDLSSQQLNHKKTKTIQRNRLRSTSVEEEAMKVDVGHFGH